MSDELHCLIPEWSAPEHVQALSTTRHGGISTGCWSGLNLAGHVGDDSGNVAHNRDLLYTRQGLPSQPVWLNQIHGDHIVQAEHASSGDDADGSMTAVRRVVCVVQTADCVPVLMCDRAGTQVAALHAGWRGLASGILSKAASRFSDPDNLIAWIGPCISQAKYEVDESVRCQFSAAHDAFFNSGIAGHWYLDCAGLAKKQLIEAGVGQIFGGTWCTASSPEQFYSYRRDGRTGRMASLIWLE